MEGWKDLSSSVSKFPCGNYPRKIKLSLLIKTDGLVHFLRIVKTGP
jgi:uncharacterized protein (DUF3820 family)